MAKKKMTAAQLQAIDWNKLFTTLIQDAPQVAAFLLSILQAFGQKQGVKPHVAVGCDDETKCCCEAACETLAEHCCTQLKLHQCICGCCESE